MSSVLTYLRAAGVLSALDEHLARTLGRLAGEHDERVLLSVALVSRQVAHGHVCLSLPELHAGELRVELAPGFELPAWPEATALREALLASPLVGDADAQTPLVLGARDRLYLRRYFEHERDLALALRARMAAPDRAVDRVQLEAGLLRLFGAEQPDTIDLQRRAAELAVTRPFLVISGGPGTGKTSTVVKVLALIIEQELHAGRRPPRVDLMAPTGKAAVRVVESIRAAKRDLPCTDAVRAAIPEEASTIHRALLGVAASGGRFVSELPAELATDLVLVDEASMVDLSLMARLFSALPAHARVILLGDKHQLASVEAGAVLADICGASLRDEERAQVPLLARSVVHLQQSYRYGEDSGIGRLARAINAGDADGAIELLASSRFADIELCEEATPSGLGERLRESILAGYEPCLRERDPERALQAFSRFRVLCAHRRGLRGVEAMGTAIMQLFLARGLLERAGEQVLGAPILITHNDYPSRLWNGDVGVLGRGLRGERLAFFAPPEGDGVRHLPLSRLPPYESAFSMSIHKSQGSEVDEVAVLLPAEPSPLLTRELLYTAVTRARRKVVIHANEAVVRAAVGQVVARSSGLGDALYGSEHDLLNRSA